MLVISCPQAPCQRLDDPLFLWGSPGCLIGGVSVFSLLLLSLLGLLCMKMLTDSSLTLCLMH